MGMLPGVISGLTGLNDSAAAVGQDFLNNAMRAATAWGYNRAAAPRAEQVADESRTAGNAVLDRYNDYAANSAAEWNRFRNERTDLAPGVRAQGDDLVSGVQAETQPLIDMSRQAISDAQGNYADVVRQGRDAVQRAEEVGQQGIAEAKAYGSKVQSQLSDDSASVVQDAVASMEAATKSEEADLAAYASANPEQAAAMKAASRAKKMEAMGNLRTKASQQYSNMKAAATQEEGRNVLNATTTLANTSIGARLGAMGQENSAAGNLTRAHEAGLSGVMQASQMRSTARSQRMASTVNAMATDQEDRKWIASTTQGLQKSWQSDYAATMYGRANAIVTSLQYQNEVDAQTASLLNGIQFSANPNLSGVFGNAFAVHQAANPPSAGGSGGTGGLVGMGTLAAGAGLTAAGVPTFGVPMMLGGAGMTGAGV